MTYRGNQMHGHGNGQVEGVEGRLVLDNALVSMC